MAVMAPEGAKVVSKQPCPKHTKPMIWVHISQDSPAVLILRSRNDPLMGSEFGFWQACNGQSMILDLKEGSTSIKIRF